MKTTKMKFVNCYKKMKNYIKRVSHEKCIAARSVDNDFEDQDVDCEKKVLDKEFRMAGIDGFARFLLFENMES